MVAPLKFSKISLQENKLVQQEFTLEGRKSPLNVIREQLFQRNKSLYRCQNESDIGDRNDCIRFLSSINELKDGDGDDEEVLKKRVLKIQTSRNLAAWHDCATIVNHKHILFMIQELFDPAIHLNDMEASKKLKRKVDAQTFIEEPII